MSPLNAGSPQQVKAAETAQHYIITGHEFRGYPRTEVLVIRWGYYNDVDGEGNPTDFKSGRPERVMGEDLKVLQSDAPTEATRRADFKKALYDYMIDKGIFPAGTLS